jgi:hypothetical protein
VIRPKDELRYELKYLLRRDQVAPLVAELRQILPADPHAGEVGMYPITSLYYDTYDYSAYWAKLDGQRNRRKIRVRVYGSATITPDTLAFVEIKQRINKLMRKRRAALAYSQAVDLESYYELGLARSGMEQALLHEVYYLYSILQLRPACVVTYDRIAFEGTDLAPDLRVTVDVNLRGRARDLTLLSTGMAADHLVMGPEFAVLEVKANHNVPRWVAQLLARHQCSFYRISKYCMVLDKCEAISGRQRILAAA